MGNFRRVKGEMIPPRERAMYTCSVEGCPQEALVRLPMNAVPFLAAGSSELSRMFLADENVSRWQQLQSLLKFRTIYISLCHNCIRSFATGLPEGERLYGAVLQYPEIVPYVASAEEIPGTPEAQGLGRKPKLERLSPRSLASMLARRLGR